jgi:hypothetical protein
MNKPVAFFLAAVACGAATLQPVPATAGALTLACRTHKIVFNDGTSFASAHFTVEIDPTLGWTISYNQFVKRFPEGLTVIIARETGAYVKFDKSSHLQTGACRTLGASRFEWLGASRG